MAQFLFSLLIWLLFLVSLHASSIEAESTQREALVNFYTSKRFRLRTGFENLSPPDQEEIFKASGIDALFSIGTGNRLSKSFNHEDSQMHRSGAEFRHLRINK